MAGKDYKTLIVQSITQLQQSVEHFVDNSTVDHIDGEFFKLTLVAADKTMVVAHGYSLMGDKNSKSPTVDVMFIDSKLSPSSYVIYMTESEPDEYPWNIQEAQRLAVAFFEDKYTLKVSKYRKKPSLEFNQDNLTYTVATPI